jgi:uncharacterized membrane protein YkoI
MKTMRGISILTAMAAVALAASSAAAQAPAAPAAPAKHETAKQLQAEAKVAEKAARATALAQVPGGKVTKHELERENGKVLYSYDIATKGKSGIDEVQIDAVTGTVLSNKHETPAMEKAEATTDAKAHAARKAHKKARAEKKA